MPLNDAKFTQMVINYWLDHVMGSHIFLPLKDNPNIEISEDIFKALEPHFGKDASFVSALVQLYVKGKFIMTQNRDLNLENQQLKDKLEKIEQILKV